MTTANRQPNKGFPLMRTAIIALVLGIVPLVSHAAGAGLHITRSPWEEGGTLADTQVYNGFGCTGGNVSPEVAWQGAPEGTQSYAVTVYDPDAPTGSGWWHWLVVNIPATVKALPQGNDLPAGALTLKNDYGTTGFGGACPPEKAPAHRYRLTVWALKTRVLPLTVADSAAKAGFFLNANALASTTVTGMYGR